MKLNQDKHIKKDKRQLRVRKQERTKQTILTKAEKFFSEKPMNQVSLEDIAEAAFVSRTTLYNYFKNKDEIFFTLGRQTFKKMNEDIKKNYS
jgi:AcrR family transcriptional regulator